MKLTKSHAAASAVSVFLLTGIVLVASHQVGGKKPSTITNYWVSTVGSDSNNGLTPATAWLTVNKAGQTVTSGAVVHVANGTYTTPVTIANNGTATSRIVFQADNTWGASVQGATSYGFTILGDYVDVRNFDVTATGANVAIAGEGNHDQVIGNRVHAVGDTGGCSPGGGAIDMFGKNSYGEVNDVLVQGNLVYNVGQTTCFNGGNQVHGIYATSSGVKIYDNIVGNIHGFGIHCWHACNAPVISGNTVFTSDAAGIIVGTGDSGSVPVFDYSVVTNNISINNATWGMQDYGYTAASEGTHEQWLNNHTFGNTSGSFVSSFGKNSASGTLTTNPSLVNYQASGLGDYHLNAGADDIDAGIGTGMAPTDYNGVPRDNPPDIGAYEVINS